MRVDLDTKRLIESAAERQGLSTSTFVIRAARAAAEGVARRAKARESDRAAPRQTSGACPTFFRAACWEARRGGDRGYNWVGQMLMRHVPSLIAWESQAELIEKFEKLEYLIQDEDDDGVLTWFDRELPKCMAWIPRRRRPSFLAGIYQAIEDDDGLLTP
jgi:hypothetical protein